MRNGIPPVKWLAKPYLVEQELNLWIGDGYTAKSMLALDTAIGLASGNTVLFGSPVSRPYRVLFMDEDSGPAQTSRRVLQLAKGRGLCEDATLWANLTVYVQNGFSLGSAKALKELEEYLKFYKPEVLILDALRAFHGFDENKSDEMALLMRKIIRPLIVRHSLLSIIMLHHTAKDTPGRHGAKSASAASRGSTEIRNAPDVTLHLVRIRDVPTVTMEKARNLSSKDRAGVTSFDIKDLGGDQDGIIIQTIRPEDRLKKSDKAKRDILTVFASDPGLDHTQATLERALTAIPGRDYSSATAYTVLKGMVGYELTSRVEKGQVYYRTI
jgi:RecA-family ATPase